MYYPFAENIEVTDAELEKMMEIDDEDSDLEPSEKEISEPEYQTILLRRQHRNRRATGIKVKKRWRDRARYTGSTSGLTKAGSENSDEEDIVYRKKSCYSHNGVKSLSHYLKRLNNKKVRRTAKIPQRGGYKKAAESDWILD